MENVSICSLLFHREIDYRHKRDRLNSALLKNMSCYLAEKNLLLTINQNKKLIKVSL